uniref:Fibronectin type III domain containing 1 n=1 Tax=Gopherus evgoodei TaxID=1825980 RepID=A0A8C4YT82_9SAUR
GCDYEKNNSEMLRLNSWPQSLLYMLDICTLYILEHPLKPRNVQLLPTKRGLKVIPVEQYNLVYEESLKKCRYICHILSCNTTTTAIYYKQTTTTAIYNKCIIVIWCFCVFSCLFFEEKEVPNKPLRVRVRSPGNKLSVRWKLPQASGLRNPRRPHGYLLGYGESSRKMSYVPLQKRERSQEAKKLASESVYVVSLQSRNSQGQSQPVYSAALTKRKVSEEDELEEAKDISVRVMSSQSVLVTWMDPIYEKPKKVDPTRRYAVRYREKGESARWDYKQVPNRRVLVDMLIPDTVYEFAVQISEGEKEGKWSASVYQRTPEAAPASAPENLDVWPIKGKTTSVTASWDPLAESEGKVKEYILSYAPALKPFGAKSITYRGGTTSAIIDGLQPGERYIFKIRAANRRGQGPQSKAFSVIMPTGKDDSNVHQQTNIQDNMESKKPGDDVPSSPSRTFSVPSRKIQPSASSKHTAVHSSSSPSGGDTKSPLSEFKNKLLTGSGVLNKSQLFSKKTSEREPDPQFTEVTDDQDSSIEMPTALPKTQDQRRNIGPYSPSRPFPSVLSSGRTPVRPRTPVRTRQMSTNKHGSSSSSLSQRSSSSAFSPISKYTDNETKRQRQGNSNIPSSPKIPLDNLPAENVPHDIADSVEEKQVSLDSVPLKKAGSSQVSPKTPEHTRLALPLNRQSSVSRKVVQSHQTKPHISSVPVKLPTSSTVTNSQSHSRSNPHMLKDPKLATAAASSQSAVSASASHTLTNSRTPSSAKRKYDGRDVDDGNYSEDTETEGEEKRQDFSSSRFNSRSFLGQTASEHFNLLKHKSSHTINKFPNKISSSQESKLPPSKPPYSAVSSKVHAQTNARLTSASATRSSSNIERDTREREGEDEKPLPSTIAHDHSSSSSRQSSSAAVYSRRRSPSVESSVHRREPVKQKSQLPGSEDELLITEIEETPTKSGSLLTVRRSSSLPSISGRSPLSTKTNHHSSPSVSHQVTNGQYGSSSSSLSKLQQSVSQISKVDEKHKSSHDSLTSSRGSSSSLPAGRHVGSRVATSNGQVSDSYKQSSSSYQSEPSQPGSSSITDTAKDNQNSRDTSLSSKSSSTSLRQTHPSVPNYHSGSRVPTRIAFKSEKKYGPFQSQPSKVEPSPKAPFSSISKSRQSGSKDDDDGEGEVEEKPTLSSAARWSSSSNSRGSTNMNGNGARDKRKPMGSRLIHKVNSTPNKPHRSSKPRLDWPGSSASISVPSQLYPTRSASPTLTSSSSPVVPHQRLQRQRNLSQRQFVRPPYRQGSNGRPNLTTKTNMNGKILPGNNGKLSGQRIINGPQGTKWIVDLDRGLVLNAEGRYLQDSQGNPLRVKLGGDGRTIVDAGGAPVVSPDGLPLFGHGRFSKPLASAQDKPVVSLGGKPLIGLEMIKKTTTSSTTMTTIPPTTTTATTTTTTITTTTPEPTTTELPTEKPLPTCPPGTDAQYDEEGKLVIGPGGLLECTAEGNNNISSNSRYDVSWDFEFFESTLPPTTTMITTTTPEAVPETDYPEISVAGSDPMSEFDLAGKKRFTAPYVSYLNKDPAAPCSLTEALEHFQVESLDEIIPYNLKEGELRPRTVPYNITVVAVEGCHSFVIVDWTKPRQGDLITGYLVYSASYDDFIRNKWSTKTAGATHLPIENLKPNTRYYFKVQAKNPYGYGPISSSVSFVTESDNPLLIVRPPGGEPIWIPFTFKYDPTYSDCSGKQYVKRTWYRKFVGVVLCNSLRYKIYLSDDLKDTFYGIGDSWGRGEDHCQFVDSHMDGRTGPQSYVEALPTIQGYYRQYRQEPVSFGRIGYTTPYYYVSWYECGVPIPGKW